MIEVLELEPRLCPVVHPFAPAALVAQSPNAAGTPANAIVAANLGGLPAPLVASDGAVPFDSVPGRLEAACRQGGAGVFALLAR